MRGYAGYKKMSNRRSKILRSEIIDEVLHGRLINWGRYLRSDDTYRKLGYPGKCPFTIEPVKGETISEIDAMHIEEIVSSFHASKFKLLPVHGTILKVEYAEKPEGFMGPVKERAYDIGRIYRTRISETRYYEMLSSARFAVSVFVSPLR